MLNALFVDSGQDVSLNATYNLGSSNDNQDNSQEMDYTDDVMNQGAEGCEEGYVEEGYEGEEAFTEEYNQEDNTEINYSGRLSEGDDGFQDEVLDLEINEPIDGEFQVSSHVCLLSCKSPCTHNLSHTHVRANILTLLFLSNSIVCKR